MNVPPTSKPYQATPLTLPQLASGRFIEFTSQSNFDSHEAYTFIELEDRILWGDLHGQWENGSGVWSWIEAGHIIRDRQVSFEEGFHLLRYMLNQHNKGVVSPFLIINENYQRDAARSRYGKLIDVVWNLGDPR